MSRYLDDLLARWRVEETDEWRRWSSQIPTIDFPAGWLVRITPPSGGAVVRFRVSTAETGGKDVSVYLDCYDRLGVYGAPYWEICPYDDAGWRVGIDDVDQLVLRIGEAVAQLVTARGEA